MLLYLFDGWQWSTPSFTFSKPQFWISNIQPGPSRVHCQHEVLMWYIRTAGCTERLPALCPACRFGAVPHACWRYSSSMALTSRHSCCRSRRRNSNSRQQQLGMLAKWLSASWALGPLLLTAPRRLECAVVVRPPFCDLFYTVAIVCLQGKLCDMHIRLGGTLCPARQLGPGRLEKRPLRQLLACCL
jgi:hypothetical protein